MLVSKYGFKYNFEGKLVRKKVKLLNMAKYYVHIKCDECGQIFKTLWNNRQVKIKKGKLEDHCNSCSKSGQRNPSYGKDRSDILKYARTFVKENPMKGRKHSKEARIKMSERKAYLISHGLFNISSNSRGNKSWYYSEKNKEEFYCDSDLEKLRMTQLDDDENIIRWTKRHKIRVPYIWKGVQKYTIPDFLIVYKNKNKVIEEVKGYVTKKELAKKRAVQKFCKKNNYIFRFLTKKDI